MSRWTEELKIKVLDGVVAVVEQEPSLKRVRKLRRAHRKANAAMGSGVDEDTKTEARVDASLSMAASLVVSWEGERAPTEKEWPMGDSPEDSAQRVETLQLLPSSAVYGIFVPQIMATITLDEDEKKS